MPTAIASHRGALTASLALVVVAALLVPQSAFPAAPRQQPQAQQQELYRQLQRGIDQLQEGHAEKGLEEIQKVIAEEPRLAMAQFYAGMASAQLRRWQQAYDYFVAATEQAPGYGQAHMQACRVAYNLHDYDASFAHAVLAAQAGVDMADAFAGLETVMKLPEDWRQLLGVPRVLIGNIDIQALLEQGSSAFGGHQAEAGPASADASGVAATNPLGEFLPPPAAGTFPLGLGTSGAGLAAELQAEIHEVRRRFGEQLEISTLFGVVTSRELATYVLFIKVDDVGEGTPTPLKGFVKLLDPASGQEIYSRPLELSNIQSVSDLRNDVARYVGYMEEWLRRQRR